MATDIYRPTPSDAVDFRALHVASEETIHGKKRVLVVDDELAEITGVWLSADGYETCAVTTPQAARAELAKGRGFDFVVLDFNLNNGVNGYDLAREIHENSSHSETPILLYSSDIDSIKRACSPENRREAGIIGIVEKDLDMIVTTGRIREAHQSWLDQHHEDETALFQLRA